MLKPLCIAHSLPTQGSQGKATEDDESVSCGDMTAADGGHASCGGSSLGADFVLLQWHLFPRSG